MQETGSYEYQNIDNYLSFYKKLYNCNDDFPKEDENAKILREEFLRKDKDKNCFLSKKELGIFELGFNEMDESQDSQISLHEFIFEKGLRNGLDQNKDGLISSQEWGILEQFLPKAMTFFEIIDFDMDENISFYEYDISKTAESLNNDDALSSFHAEIASLYPTLIKPTFENLKKHDKNSDGKIQIEEYLMRGSGLVVLFFKEMIDQMGTKPFQNPSKELLPILIALDKDGDNEIDISEYKDFAKRFCLGSNKLPEESLFILFDSDYSNNLDWFEVGALEGFPFIFETMDTNGNFKLEFGEVQDHFMDFSRYQRFQDGKLIFDFKKIDVNNDGELTLIESGLSLANFQKIDVNNDGGISPGEAYVK
tara:strand:+ start:631 stop:1728 length:1098 start_codon:yes stop_codon:yes gene_type:complete